MNASDLIWNTAGAGNFIGAQTWSYEPFDALGTVATTDNPFTLVGVSGGAGGENRVFIGFGGAVTLDASNQGPFGDSSLFEIRIGTQAGEANLTAIGGPDLRGSGSLAVSNGASLLLFDDAPGTADSKGRLIVGGAGGITGVLDWNSTGTLATHAHMRVGQSGTGAVNQNLGTVRTGYRTITTGSAADQNMRVGSSGGNGTYHLNNGAFELGDDDEEIGGNPQGVAVQQILEVGHGNNSVGIFNVGDGSGGAGSATFDTWGTVFAGLSNGGTGTINVNSDGVFRVNYGAISTSSAQLVLGQSGGGSNGTLNQTGGVVAVDGLLSIGASSGSGAYVLNGSSGTANVRALTATSTADLTFNLDAGGATKISVDGNTGSNDVASGNSISLSNAMLNIGGLSNYLSTNSITLLEQVDTTAELNGSFANYIQGQAVGLNGNLQQFYLNYFGGDGNDIVLQSTTPTSSLDGLVWNAGTANFDAGWAEGDGNFGVGNMGVSPFGTTQNLYLGKNGHATYNASTNDSGGSQVKNLYIGTNRGAGVVSGTAGNGTLTVSDAENLTVVTTTDPAQGNMYIGERGFTGTVNWNSTGTLDVQGQFRVGVDGGTGVLTQTAGIVQAGTGDGAGWYFSVGDGDGSTGTYNLDGGQFLPDGPGAGSPGRHTRVGTNGGTGTFNIGDGVGAAQSAHLQTEEGVYVGQTGGTGTMTIESDGYLQMTTDANPFLIGSGGGNGTVIQNGGAVTVDRFISIGEGDGSVGEYVLNSGTMVAAADGDDTTRVGGGGGTGTFRVKGGSYTTTQNIVVAQAANSGSVGLLEFTGSTASFDVGRLETHTGNDATMSWIADANGVTEIRVINGANPNRVQLQSPTDATANTGTNGSGDLTGHGAKLLLDLSALSTTQLLPLIDNRSSQQVVGFFGDGTNVTGNLYEEGEQVLGTGFPGTVTISYIGQAPGSNAGNDVVLSLVAGVTEDADFDADGDIDGADFLTWQRNVSKTTGANLADGDANNDDAVDGDDLAIWEGQFGTSTVASAPVPEPGSLALLLMAAGLIGGIRARRAMHGA